MEDDGGWTPVEMLSLFAITATVGGIWLLVRQWTWGEWLAWAAPLVFTAVVSFMVASDRCCTRCTRTVSG